jgi:hypothetical protein
MLPRVKRSSLFRPNVNDEEGLSVALAEGEEKLSHNQIVLKNESAESFHPVHERD